MSAATTHRADAVRRGAMVGMLGGMAGGIVMAMYAMVVSATVKDVGFFTPLYHIASSIISPQAMMTSMDDAAHGHAGYFTAGPALVGLLVHMMTGAVAGGAFGAAVAGRGLARPVTVAVGGVFGLLVLLANSFVGLPVVASVFGGGGPISDMPKMVGWGTFTVEHLMFGLVLGLVVAAAATVRAAGTSAAVGARTA
jgi:hypothetical protein